MNAYFDTIKYLLNLMWLMLCFSMPIQFMYSGYDALKGQPMYMITKYSLGNLGGAETLCKIGPADADRLPLSCNVGLMNADNLTFGIIPSTSKVTNYCMNNFQNEKIPNCTRDLNEPKIRQYIR